MSQYLDIYIKDSQNRLLRLGTFPSNSTMYEIFHDIVPFEKAKFLSVDDMKRIYNEAVECEKDYKEKMDEVSDFIHIIQNMNNPMSEKVEYLHDYINDLHELRTTIEDIAVVKAQIKLLFEIQENNEIYAGIECGDDPELA